jgi:predicted RNase H-like HicB family nuclease
MVRHFPAVLTPADEGGFVAECPLIPGCISEGDSREEALANLRDAIELCLQDPLVREREQITARR